MTFKEFILKRAKITSSPTGDFILEARRDQNLPDTAMAIIDRYRLLKGRAGYIAAKNCFKNYKYHCHRNGLAAEST